VKVFRYILGDFYREGGKMPLSPVAKGKIKRMIMSELRRKIEEFSEREDMNKPFYFRLFSKEVVYTASLLQSIFTWFGGKWEYFAEIIARENFPRVKRRYRLKGTITSKELIVIDTILKELDEGVRTPDIERTKQEILQAYDKNDSYKEKSHIIDLFIETENGEEYYFELKTVKPNKKEVRAAKRDFLEVLAMRHKEKDLVKVHVFLAIPFNPYFSEEYSRWTVIKFFKPGDDLLVGKDFWNLLGGENTYEDLLNTFEEVGEELMDIIERTINRLVEE